MTVAEKKRIGKYLIEICYDPDSLNPRVDYDNLATMACFHSRHSLGDQNRDDFPWPNTQEGMHDFQEWLNEHQDEVIYKPLKLYEHGGMTISTNSEYPYNDRWDSSSIGVIYVEKEKILKEFGLKEWGPEAEKKANGLMDAEVETYDYYLRGDVYGYKVTDTEKNEEVESCWGFLGESNHCLEDAESLVKNLIKADQKWEAEAMTSVRYLQVRVEIKHSANVDPDEVINECDYNFTSQTDDAKIVDTEIQEQEGGPLV
jgi:hypothetical protein